ncbi:MAG: glycosyltransferase family 4 protein [Planctomycetaceae bacterium]
MRVGLLFEYPTVNGGENSMLAVAAHLSDMQSTDIELHAFAPHAGELARRLDVIGVDRSQWDMFQDGLRRDRSALIAELSALTSEFQLDLLHANSLSMGRLTGAAGSGFPCSTSAHLRDILRLSNAAVRDLNRNSRLIAVSEATRKFHIQQGVDSERIVTVHNGIDVDGFAGGALPAGAEDAPAVRILVRRSVRREFGIPEDAFVILSVGQIGLRKGLDILAEAVVLLAGSMAVTAGHESLQPVHLLLAGARFSTKPESIEYEQRVLLRLREAAPQIVLHPTGYRGDVARLMLAADTLVHAARQEPLGRVLIEAGAAGLPIVATSAGGTSEILEDGRSALLVSVDQPEQLMHAVNRLRMDPEFRSRMGRLAEKTIRSQFGVDRSAAVLVSHWREICRGKRQS